MRPREAHLHQARPVRTRHAREVFGSGALHAGCGSGQELSRDWATFRFAVARLRSEDLPEELSFSGIEYGQQIKDEDQRENVVANILAGHEPENDVTILSTNLTSFGKQSLGSSVVAAGTADIALQKTFTKDGDTHTQTWIIAVRFFLNPDQVDAQSADNPDYQTSIRWA